MSLPTTRPDSPADPPRVLLLGSSGLGWPAREELERRIAADEVPDLLTLHLHATPVDEAYLQRCPGPRGSVLRLLPLPVAQALVALREREAYDVVLTWSEPATYVLALLVLLTRSDLQHVSVHSWISKPKKAVPLKLLHRGIRRMVVPPATQHAFALRWLRLPAAKLPDAAWGVDLRFWRADRPLTAETTDTISCVGREMRDYPTLVDALRGTDLPCHIAPGALRAADNPWLSRLDTELPRNVTLGTRRGRQLRELYARSRFTVVPLLPSHTDNGVTAILESFAMARPVICTRTPGQVGTVQHGVNGLLVPPHDPQALREAMLRLWDDPEECARLGANARAWVEEHHSLLQWEAALVASVRGALG